MGFKSGDDIGDMSENKNQKPIIEKKIYNREYSLMRQLNIKEKGIYDSLVNNLSIIHQALANYLDGRTGAMVDLVTPYLETNDERYKNSSSKKHGKKMSFGRNPFAAPFQENSDSGHGLVRKTFLKLIASQGFSLMSYGVLDRFTSGDYQKWEKSPVQSIFALEDQVVGKKSLENSFEKSLLKKGFSAIAVGGAMASNLFLLAIPCHLVLHRQEINFLKNQIESRVTKGFFGKENNNRGLQDFQEDDRAFLIDYFLSDKTEHSHIYGDWSKVSGVSIHKRRRLKNLLIAHELLNYSPSD